MLDISLWHNHPLINFHNISLHMSLRSPGDFSLLLCWRFPFWPGPNRPEAIDLPVVKKSESGLRLQVNYCCTTVCALAFINSRPNCQRLCHVQGVEALQRCAVKAGTWALPISIFLYSERTTKLASLYWLELWFRFSLFSCAAVSTRLRSIRLPSISYWKDRPSLWYWGLNTIS